MKPSEIVLNILKFIYIPMDVYVPIIFWYCESLLRTLTVGIVVVLTIGKILSLMKSKFCTFLRYIMYIYYVLYFFYSFNVIHNLFNTNPIVFWSTFLLGVVAPICMFILFNRIRNTEIRGHKIFNYFVLMLLYIIIGYIWYLFLPETVEFMMLFYVWLFAGLIVIIVMITEYFTGGNKNAKK